jgi:hypothetical protein
LSVEYIGWGATALFTLSYFVKGEINLLKLQAIAALVWCMYGVLLNSYPVLVANIIVALSASFGVVRHWRQRKVAA